MEIHTKKIKLSKIKANPNNPRIIRDDKFKKLKKSIQDFPDMLGIREIVVDEDMVILGGNMRYRALQDLNIKETQVKIVEGLTEEQKKEFIIKDNVGFGDWDWDELANEWDQEELNDWGLDTPDEWGSEEVPPEEGQDDVPELKKEPFVVRGDIFEIKAQGLKYRIGCLDSTSIDDVNKLLDGNNIDLVFTDPPYGVNITKIKKKEICGRVLGKLPEIAGDKNTTVAKEFYNICQSINIKNYIIWGGNYFTDFLPPSRCWFIWDKEVPPNFTFAEAELAWCSLDKNTKVFKQAWSGNLAGKVDKSTEGLEVEILNKSAKVNRVHPTQKPVQVQKDILKSVDSKGSFKNLYDPFVGGGSMILVGIQMKRNVFAQEYTEYYTQVTVKRAVDFLQNNNIDFEITLNNQKFDLERLN